MIPRAGSAIPTRSRTPSSASSRTRLLVIQVTNPPEKFPFKDAVQKIWTVIHLDDAGPGRTRLRIVGVGYGDDEESRKLRAFFEAGNGYTIKKLQAKFAGTKEKPSKAG